MRVHFSKPASRASRVAHIIALKINSLITQNRATRLDKLSTATSKQLWDAVNKSRHHNADNGSSLLMRDPDAINDFFANIAAKENYDRNELLKFRCENPDVRSINQSINQSNTTISNAP